MLRLRAWSDDLNVILFEFFDDDTKLPQSCMGIGMDCDKHTQDTPSRSICWFVSRVASNLDETSGNAAPLAWVAHGFARVCAVKQDLFFSVPHRHQTSSDCRYGLGILRQGTTAGKVMFVNFFFFKKKIGLPQPDTFLVAVLCSSLGFPCHCFSPVWQLEGR